MKRILLSLLTLLSLTAFSQTDTLIRYLDYNFSPTQRGSHNYEAVSLFTKMADGNMMVQDYYSETGKKLQQYYLSASDTSIRIGPYISYHLNGEIKTKGNYKDGKKLGLWRGWHSNKILKDSLFYNDVGNISGTVKTWFDNGRLWDSAYYHPDSAGRAVKYMFYGTGEPWGQGPVFNDLENGDWTYFRRSGKVSSEETYIMGKMTRIQCYEEDGSPGKDKCEAERDAYFPGEQKAWVNYIVKAINQRFEEMARKNATGTCVVQFIVGIDGKIIETKVAKSSGTALDEFALDIIKKSPKWVPARQHNILVKAYRKQPVTFSLQ